MLLSPHETTGSPAELERRRGAVQLLEEGQSLVTVARIMGAAVGAMLLRRETFPHAGGDGLAVKRQQRLPKLLAVVTPTIAVRTSGERLGDLWRMSQQ